MKKIFLICLAVMFALCIVPISASAVETAIGTEAITEGMTDLEIDETMSLSEVILAVSKACGVSVEEAERIVLGIKAIGDEYLGENDLWVRISADMEEHPAKWTMLGLLLATVFVLIGVLIKRVITDALTAQKMKVALENLDHALNGDERDENGKALSIRAMIGEKNGQIEKLEKENEAQREEIGSLKLKAEELTGVITGLNNAISKIESNSDTSLKITEESALQLIQLINIALDRKVPITSKEARQIWYEHTQNNIKRIYEEGTDNGGEAEEA